MMKKSFTFACFLFLIVIFASPGSAFPAGFAPAAGAQKAWIGIGHDPKHSNGNGLKVENIGNGSPAQKAGVQKDDVITHINDVKIAGSTDFDAFISSCLPGDKLNLKVMRGGKEMTLDLELGGCPMDKARGLFGAEGKKIEQTYRAEQQRIKGMKNAGEIQKLIETAGAATVRVLPYHDHSTSGSGMLIEGGKYVATAGHVTNGAKYMNIILTTGQTLVCEVVKEVKPNSRGGQARSGDTDLAIMRVINPAGHPLPSIELADFEKDVNSKDTVIVMGYPVTHGVTENGSVGWGQYGGAMTPIPRLGTVGGMVGKAGTQFEVNNVLAWHGDSGCLLLTMDGKVAGNVVASSQAARFGGVTSVAFLKKCLAEVKK